MNKKYKYLLFDNDGTLMDFAKCEEEALCLAYKLTGLESIKPYSNETLKLYSEINDSWWKKLERKECSREELMIGRFREFFEELGITNIDPQKMSENYPIALSCSHVLFEGAVNLLKSLFEKYDIYIITNGIGFVQKKRISQCDYRDFIKGVYISEELGAVKPEKKYFNKVLEAIGGKADECLIIGDSLSADIKGGNLSLIDTLWFNPDGLKPKEGIAPTYIAKSYDEILSLLL